MHHNKGYSMERGIALVRVVNHNYVSAKMYCNWYSRIMSWGYPRSKFSTPFNSSSQPFIKAIYCNGVRSKKKSLYIVSVKVAVEVADSLNQLWIIIGASVAGIILVILIFTGIGCVVFVSIRYVNILPYHFLFLYCSFSFKAVVWNSVNEGVHGTVVARWIASQ